jgi:sigma-B regulation protein RsbU (phosphoserine phosphatase)
VNTALSLEERSIGGLGIHLVRQIMDQIQYRREDNKNILTLIKKM